MALSADGQRLAIYAENGVIHVYDTNSGKRVKRISAKAGEYQRAMAIAPDGSWVAWQEQLPRPGRGLPNVTVHLVGLTSGVKDRETTVAGWTKALVAHPTASELLLVTENSFTRWDPRTGAVTPEDPGHVRANTLHYSDDGELIIVENFNRVDIHANAPGLPVLARLYVLSDDEWFVETGSGSVDGSAGAHDSLATIIEGPLDTSVLPGEVAWDRFVVPGLMSDAKRYLEALPPEPAEISRAGW